MTLPVPENPRVIALFDVDGTLTIPRGEVTTEMFAFLKELRTKITIGIVGGSDLPKQEEQLGEGIVNEVTWNFSQNGLVAYHNGSLLESNSIGKHLGEDNIKRIVNWVMRYLADLDLPVKVRVWHDVLGSLICVSVSTSEASTLFLLCSLNISTIVSLTINHPTGSYNPPLTPNAIPIIQRGTFIEFRSGMLNISPIGRNCSRAERDDYEKFDLEHKIRATMVDAMKNEFADLDMTYSIGGQISFDVFPTGWDKTYCLQYIKEEEYDEIHFFGDKTFEGGNDYEIFSHERTIGHTVTSPQDTMEQVKKLFMS